MLPFVIPVNGVNNQCHQDDIIDNVTHIDFLSRYKHIKYDSNRNYRIKA